MGEAKRRKRLDPNYGKAKSVEILIAVSELTGNFLVICDGKVFDSASKRPDAERVANWLREQTAIAPLPRNWWKDLGALDRWIKERSTPAPRVNAVAFGVSATGIDRVVISG